jgi:hypothetical protein
MKITDILSKDKSEMDEAVAGFNIPDEIQSISPEFKDLSDEDARELLKKRMASRRWRLDNLYYIMDVAGNKIKFVMNYAQRLLFLSFWYCNIILKSRQHGITTLMCILMLDTCLFNSNIQACIIAHNKDDAKKFFKDKVKFAYDHLPSWYRDSMPCSQDTVGELTFANNSSLRVTTSGRSGTYQMVHVSEFGKMCAKFPAKAQEVITGTLNAIHPGMLVTIESTAEGKEGRFFDMCEIAQNMQKQGLELSKIDFKFHFFGAQENEFNVLDAPVPMPSRLVKYFDLAEAKIGIRLTNQFRWWYTAKERTQGDMMKREHPLTPEEAFEASLEGAYYATQMAGIRKAEPTQICSVPYKDGVLVNTYWDLGIDDYTSIWFAQMIGREIHVIDFYENSGEGLLHYADIIMEKKYRYGTMWAPHDMIVREFTSGQTRLATAKNMGMNFSVSNRLSIESQIQLVRQTLPICWFDAEKCERGIAALDGYRKEWNDALGVWRDKPRHDWASHGANAFVVLAQNISGVHNFNEGPITNPMEDKKLDEELASPGGWT